MPDLIAIAKGLGGGYQPIGARARRSSGSSTALARGSGFFQHGHTYIGHPVACAAALAVQQVIERDHLLDAVQDAGRAAARAAARGASATIRTSATSAAAACSWRSSSSTTAPPKRPFDPALRLHARIKAEAMARGLMVYPMGGTIDGQRRRPRAARAAVHHHACRDRRDRAPARASGGRRRRVAEGSLDARDARAATA